MRFDLRTERTAAMRRLVLAAAAVALLSGCANRDSVTVGSVPDDYRTRHPIVVSEKEQTVDVPLAPSGRVRIQNAGSHPYLNCVVALGGVDVFAGTALAGGEEVFHLPSGPVRVRLSVFDASSTEVPRPRLFDETHEVTVVAGEEVVVRAPR